MSRTGHWQNEALAGVTISPPAVSVSSSCGATSSSHCSYPIPRCFFHKLVGMDLTAPGCLAFRFSLKYPWYGHVIRHEKRYGTRYASFKIRKVHGKKSVSAGE